MKKFNIRLLLKRILFCLLGFIFILFIISFFVKIDKEPLFDNIFPSSNELSNLNFDSSRSYQKINLSEALNSDNELLQLEYNSDYKDNCYRFDQEEKITMFVSIDSSDNYEIALDYQSLQKNIEKISINVKIDNLNNDKYNNIVLPTYWQDDKNEHIYDIYQNEVSPLQSVYRIWNKYFLYDQRYYDLSPLSFTLNEGIHSITIEKNSGEFLLGNIYLYKKEDLKRFESFENYQKNDNCYMLEGEKPLYKSATDIKAISTSMVHLTPFSTSKNMLNNLSGDSFNESGHSVTYCFDIKESGYYNIAIKYYISQTFTNSYAKILIDNIINYEELNCYKFENKKNNQGTSYDIEELKNSNKENIKFYFEEGIHFLTIQLDASKQAPIYYELVNIINEINTLYLEIIKLTGGNFDKNKNWKLEEYIPDISIRLNDWINRLENVLDLVKNISQSNVNKQNRLYQQIENAYKKIKTLAKNPNSIPHKLSLLQEGSASASLMLSNSLHTSTFNPLSIDKIYIYGDNYKLPKIKNSIFSEFFKVLQKIFRIKVVEESEDAVNIWVNRSTYYVSTMQQFADAYYTPHSNIKIRFSLLPDEGKLTYANASNTQPDAAFGVSSSVPYTLGIRGALVDLHEMEGFGEVISEYPLGAIIPLLEGNKVYGLPETQDFQVTFYRKDILDAFSLNVPNTYDEIINILPTLNRFGMNYYMPLAGGAGLKSLAITAPFYYQYGCNIYSDDYLTVEIDTPEGLEAMTMMVDLFNIYSLPLQTQNFYDNFRNGLSPIGISGFETYMQLSNAALEIEGKWDIALAPGVKKNDVINRTQSGDSKDVIIFNKSKKQNQAWDFIKWWLSCETQTNFASEIVATYGKTFMWNTANLKAFATLPIPKKHKDIILNQLEYLYQVPQTPATYMVERGISNAWNACVFNHVSIRASVTDYSLEINREIKRKMVEFFYQDEKGNVLKPYIVPTLEELKAWTKEGDLNGK